MLTFSSGNSGFSLLLTNKVLAHLEKNKQVRQKDKEAGGQLFARFEKALTIIEEVTGPRPTDRRTRTSYQPDKLAEKSEIKTMFEKGLHYVGDWHTHPAPIASPSGVDISNIRSCVNKSKHELNGFVMIIVGTMPLPIGLRVSIHTGQKEILLSTIMPTYIF